MKKVLLLLLCAAMLLTLAACGSVKNVQTEEVASERYSQKDIEAAIGAIKKEFVRNWNGCTLTEISYAGDDVSENHREWAERKNILMGDLQGRKQYQSLCTREQALMFLYRAVEKD